MQLIMEGVFTSLDLRVFDFNIQADTGAINKVYQALVS